MVPLVGMLAPLNRILTQNPVGSPSLFAVAGSGRYRQSEISDTWGWPNVVAPKAVKEGGTPQRLQVSDIGIVLSDFGHLCFVFNNLLGFLLQEILLRCLTAADHLESLIVRSHSRNTFVF